MAEPQPLHAIECPSIVEGICVITDNTDQIVYAGPIRGAPKITGERVFNVFLHPTDLDLLREHVKKRLN